jgi:hypothetical protein
MTQRQIKREVASATGESLSEVRRLGFSLIGDAEANLEPGPVATPAVINWDEQYLVELPRRHHRPLRVAA